MVLREVIIKIININIIKVIPVIIIKSDKRNNNRNDKISY